MPDPALRPSDRSAALARVAKGDLCAGCGACAGLAPGKVALHPTGPGFPRPVQSAPLAPAEEAAITAACPGLRQHVEPDGRHESVLWGPYREMMTGWSTDPEMRFAGASGGALSALVTHLLETGTVDAVMQIAADPDLPVGNATVIATDRAEVLAAAGSRYAPSSPLADLDARLADHAATGRRFAFVGKPCDAAALSVIRARDPAAAAAFPVIVSFFCAGVPSRAGAETVLSRLGTTLGDTAAFRYRGHGWPGRATATARDGRERSMSYHDCWGGVLSKHVQHRCKICADGTGAAADIVCADAWESDAAGYPLFDEAPGVSLIVTRTDLGAATVARARAAGHIETAPFDPAGLAAIQPGQRERRRAVLARLAALRLLGRPVPHYTGLRLVAAARQNPVGRNLRNFLGTLRRAFRGSRAP